MSDKEKQIEEMMLTVPQKIVAYDGNPAGQHLYGEQRQEIAEALYNAGYRKVPIGSVIVSIEEREAIEKHVEELIGKGAHIEIENYELMKTARALFDTSARTTDAYVAFRQLLDVSDFALHAKERIYEANAEIERLRGEIKKLRGEKQ
jgi:hypothetical protein